MPGLYPGAPLPRDGHQIGRPDDPRRRRARRVRRRARAAVRRVHGPGRCGEL